MSETVIALVAVRLRDGTENRRVISIRPDLIAKLGEELSSKPDVSEAAIYTRAFWTHKTFAGDTGNDLIGAMQDILADVERRVESSR